MKNLLYIILFILSRGIAIYAQPSGTINTPKGNTIEYFIYSLGDTAFYRAQAESLISSNNWDATIEAPASGRYNCHSYAWHVAENGTEYWINAWDYGEYDIYNGSITPTNTPTNLIEYWSNDGGYHNISKVAKAKVYYGSQWVWKYTFFGYRWVNEKDHSAIVDSNTDYFISKWGSLPRYKHKPSHCPYTSSSLSYFKLDAPVISGTSSAICNNSQRTFASDIIEPNFTYNWNITSPLTEVSGDGTSLYNVSSGSQDGQSALSLSITTPSGVTVSTNKSVWVGEPNPGNFSVIGTDIYGGSVYNGSDYELCAGESYSFYLSPSYNLPSNHHRYGITDIDFYFDFDYEVITEGYGWVNIHVWDIYDDQAGFIEVISDCGGYDDEFKLMNFVEGSCGGYYISTTPNPSKGETILTIESTSKEKALDADAEWEYEVYSDQQLLMQKQISVKGSSSTINTSGWKDGVYFIRVIYKGEVLQGKLVVKH